MMMRIGGFPWKEHRTLAEVDETECLRELLLRNDGRLVPRDRGRLFSLACKERLHNPPTDTNPRGAA